MIYRIVHRSSGITAFSSTNRGMAVHWMAVNDTDEEGNTIGLYKLVKGDK